MAFTAGLGAKDARLTFQPGDNGENREQGGKRYKRSGNHGENDAFTLEEGRPAHFTLFDTSLSAIYHCGPRGVGISDAKGCCDVNCDG